nr:MAG TPA: hypothetical protein [Caudoviricetes sp.]
MQRKRKKLHKQTSKPVQVHKGLYLRTVYGSVTGEFLKVIFQDNPEAVDEALKTLKRITKDMEFISSYSLFGYNIEADSNDRYYRPATYERASYINKLVKEMLKENEEALKEKVKELAFKRVEASTLKGIDEGDFDLSYYILDALRKGLKKEGM